MAPLEGLKADLDGQKVGLGGHKADLGSQKICEDGLKAARTAQPAGRNSAKPAETKSGQVQTSIYLPEHGLVLLYRFSVRRRTNPHVEVTHTGRSYTNTSGDAGRMLAQALHTGQHRTWPPEG